MRKRKIIYLIIKWDLYRYNLDFFPLPFYLVVSHDKKLKTLALKRSHIYSSSHIVTKKRQKKGKNVEVIHKVKHSQESF